MTPTVASLPSTISFDVREFCKDILLDKVAGFNFLVQQIAPRYGIRPWELTLAGNPPTLFLGRYGLPIIQRVVGQNNGVYAVLSVGKLMSIGRNNLKVTPSVFSGGVPISLDFFAVTNSGSMPPDGEAMWFTIEESVINTFNAEGGQLVVPQGVSFNNEIDIDPGAMEWDGVRFIQIISCTILFNRIAYGF